MKLGTLGALAVAGAVALPNDARGLAGWDELCRADYPMGVSCSAVNNPNRGIGNLALEMQIRGELEDRLSTGCTTVENWQTEDPSIPLTEMLTVWEIRSRVQESGCVESIVGQANAELDGHKRTEPCDIVQKPGESPEYNILEVGCH